MPSVDDVYNQLTDANTRLEQIKSELLDLKTSEDAVKTAVQQVNTTLTAGFGDLVTLGIYTNAALFQNAKQNDTIICLLEHISKHTCGIWNESHLQTGLQTSIDEHTTTLTELYEVTHGEAGRRVNSGLRSVESLALDFEGGRRRALGAVLSLGFGLRALLAVGTTRRLARAVLLPCLRLMIGGTPEGGTPG